ncbi:MAG: MASE1 domain-containing protein [Pirellulales bacterium]
MLAQLANRLIANSGLSLAIFTTIVAGKAFVSEPAGIVVIWPAAGLVFAALVQTNRARWGDVLGAAFAANTLGNWLLDQPAAVNLCLSIANLVEGVVAAALFRDLVRGRAALDHLRQVLALLGSALGSTLLSATVAATALTVLAGAEFSTVWITWFIADFLGILLVGGLICAWSNLRVMRKPAAGERWLRVGLAALLLACAVWVFTASDETQVWGFRRSWTLVLLAQFVALQCPPQQTLLALFSCSAIAVALTFFGSGPFALSPTSQSDHLLDLQAFLSGMVVASLLFCAAASERRQAMWRIERKMWVLERRRERAARDAAELARQAGLLRTANREAEAASKAKSMFLANMSHEIRTPLTSILGFAELLKEEPLTLDGGSAVETIYRNGDHLLTLLNDLLDLSKIESGKLELETRPLDPRALLREVAQLVRIRAEEKGLALTLTVAPSVPPTIYSDPTRLRQAFLNIALNAIKFTERGSVELSLTRMDDAASADRLLCFCVTDTGIGLQPDQVTKIFDPFVQADASTTRRFGGSGLGLAISKRIAESLGGRIDVESQPNRGSNFRFYWAVADCTTVEQTA